MGDGKEGAVSEGLEERRGATELRPPRMTEYQLVILKLSAKAYIAGSVIGCSPLRKLII